ncbi:MAG: hypothetical protein BWY69_01023 [Planctomycetes bacterium ADurb.Bin401]|nr:MAG: hypothetical protein BWY69_01023 [Planctomycetes bacterium ADurb.Bin401]
MKKWTALIILLFPSILYANPIVFDPFGSIRAILVVGSMLWMEAVILTFILCFFRLEIVPLFFALFAGNLAIYFFIFSPILTESDNVLMAEIAIVAVDGIFIKLISRMDFFQMEDFTGLKWHTAFICALIGNALSYYVGSVIIS